jgi:hypothetical protein
MSPAKKRGVRRGRAPFELTILSVSIVACAAVIGGLITAKVTQPGGPAELHLAVTRANDYRGDEIAYLVVVRNDGGDSAQNVVVKVTVGEIEREVNLTSVARGDEEKALVLFPSDATGPPQAEVESFNKTTRD